jgi:hypothetical protein
MKRLFLTAVAALLFTAGIQAQPSLTIAWDYQQYTVTEAQSFVYRFYLDQQAGVILQGVVCGTSNNITTCAAPFPLPSIGSHTVYLRAENEFGLGDPSPTIQFRYPAVPGASQNLRITKGS